MQCLRHKKVITIRYFKAANELKWQHDHNADKFYAKTCDNEHDDHVHDKRNLRLKACKQNCKKQHLGLNCYGVMGVFKNRGLRMLENDKEFVGDETIEEEVKGLSEDTTQAIKKEANAETDASAKDECMAGSWIT